MARRRRSGPRLSTKKEKRRKKVSCSFLKSEHAGKRVEPYRVLDEAVSKWHPHLKDAKIAIAWRFGWKSDTDGRITLGQAKKGSDLDRELHGYDFVILLNHEVWNQSGFQKHQKLALIDHELCHCEVSKDTNGEPKVDENNRVVYRIRKHDIEEFTEVIARHGSWKADLEMFAQKIIEKNREPLLSDDQKQASAENAKAINEKAKVRRKMTSKARRAADRLKKHAAAKKGTNGTATIPMKAAASPAK